MAIGRSWESTTAPRGGLVVSTPPMTTGRSGGRRTTPSWLPSARNLDSNGTRPSGLLQSHGSGETAVLARVLPSNRHVPDTGVDRVRVRMREHLRHPRRSPRVDRRARSRNPGHLGRQQSYCRCGQAQRPDDDVGTVLRVPPSPYMPAWGRRESHHRLLVPVVDRHPRSATAAELRVRRRSTASTPAMTMTTIGRGFFGPTTSSP